MQKVVAIRPSSI